MIVPTDPSLRFVLPEDSPYLNNMAALWTIDPQLAARIEATDGVESYLCEPSRSGPPTVVFHGHCHQKAMGLDVPARALLGRIPSCTLVHLDAGCCGMAGSFGYGRDHYDLSKKIGERKLLPAARGLQAGSVLVASGMSCRQQIADFAHVAAVHPAVLLRSLIEEAR